MGALGRSLAGEVRACADEGEIVALAGKLVSIPSYHGLPKPEEEIASFLHGFLRKNGVKSCLVPLGEGHWNVLASVGDEGGGTEPWNGGEAGLLLNGHLDTVGVDGMEGDPFSGAALNGMLSGRGSVDMKGAVAAMAMALVALRRSGVRLSKPLLFSAVADEEWWSTGTRALLESGVRARYALVGEPTQLEVHHGHRGLEWLEIRVQGRYAHGGAPERGINAIVKMNAVVTALTERLLPEIAKRVHPIAGPATLNLGRIEGGLQPSTVAGSCLLQLDRRWIPGESARSVTAEIAALLEELARKDPDFSARVVPMRDRKAHPGDNPPLCTDPSSPLVQSLASFMAERRGGFRLGRFPAWSDGGLLSEAGIETVVFGPGDLALAHSMNEVCPVADILDACDGYIAAAVALCGAQGAA
jgi:succinyl-diaminopimelate desuccinylase